MNKKMNLFAELPDSASLTPQKALGVCRFIRTGLKPALLKKLKELYDLKTPTPGQRVDTLGLEIRLEQVYHYLGKAIEIATKWQKDLSPHSRPPGLLNLETDGNSFARADTRLYFSPCNQDCVHGPISLLFAAALTGKIMRPDEQLTCIDSVTWDEPAVNNLQLYVTDSSKKKPGQEKCAVYGVFSTSLGRSLYFYGRQIKGDPVLTEGGRNAFSRQFLEDAKIEHDKENKVYRIGIAPSSVKACEKLGPLAFPAIVSTICDIADIAVMNTRRKQMKHIEHLPMLCAGKKNIALPKNMQELLDANGKLTIEVAVDEENMHVSKKSGLRIVHYRTRFLPLQDSYAGAVFAESEGLDKMFRLLSSRLYQ